MAFSDESVDIHRDPLGAIGHLLHRLVKHLAHGKRLIVVGFREEDEEVLAGIRRLLDRGHAPAACRCLPPACSGGLAIVLHVRGPSHPRLTALAPPHPGVVNARRLLATTISPTATEPQHFMEALPKLSAPRHYVSSAQAGGGSSFKPALACLGDMRVDVYLYPIFGYVHIAT